MLKSSSDERYDYSVFIALNLEEDQRVAVGVFSFFCTDLDKDVPYEEIAKTIFNRESITPDSDIEIVCNNIDYLKDVLIPKISRLPNFETIIIKKIKGLCNN